MSRLGRQLAIIARGRPAQRAPRDPGTISREELPGRPVDDVARRGLEDLVRQVERLEVRLNLILAVILGTLIVDAVKAFVH